jgi:hypothetical protein
MLIEVGVFLFGAARHFVCQRSNRLPEGYRIHVPVFLPRKHHPIIARYVDDLMIHLDGVSDDVRDEIFG